ncbi:toll/interleukin-1 receptor domain-containing protein [Halarcobacter bivalviorum]|uniref:toll/interleukin-1 receptor domain-containing protein n=1 Tax=Halarcobacter bivalviorum TaxID=663364 RepID=UPI00100A6F85|nr:toll/interleukin-1 receptor domain-containing protein [Halarcobacter bivalviorum]RXK07318.1 hypothetical protein CRU97_04200 [Halarcobacter bivalviorum]
MKVFLSHSSSDKEQFAKKIADNLGSFVIYDEYSFEEGMITFDEITTNLKNNTNLFVILLSDKALNSEWVNKELSIAYNELGNNIKRIYPIIIDTKIDHTDERIPIWLRQNYNIKPVLKVGKITTLIKRRLRELKWENNTKLELFDNLFVGRNEQSQLVEERVFNIDVHMPNAIFAMGLPKIGKKSFLKYVIKKTQSQYKKSYEFPIIYMDDTKSIEDFILLIDDLDFTINRIERESLSLMTIEEKVEISISLLIELNKHKELLLVEDMGSIITHNGEITNWFHQIIDKLKDEKEDIYLIVASRFSCFRNLKIDEYILKVKIDELEQKERVGLLQEYIKIFKIDDKVTREKIKKLSGLLKGYPEQVKYLAQRLNETSFEEVFNESNDIVEFNDDKVYELINKYQKGTKDFDLLLLLSHIDMISYELLDSILKEEKQDDYYEILEKFFIESICERFGTQKEYFRVNDVIRNHLNRLNHNIPKTFVKKLNENLTNFIEESKFEDSNLTDFFYYINQALIKGKSIPDKYLLPSHFLKTIAQSYNSQQYNIVISIAKKILNRKEYIDEFIIQEVRHYLCSSYAKKRDKRFFDEIQYIDNQSEKEFLLGFYFRLTGKFQKSIEHYNNAIEIREKFSRAKRELVQIYMNVYEFEKAFSQAKLNYNTWKNNVYHIHAYCMCIFYTDKDRDYKEELNNLIKKLSLSCYNDRVTQMYQECKALYFAYYENSMGKALDVIDNSIKEFPDSMYPLFTKFDILEHFQKKDRLKKLYLKIEEHLSKHNDLMVTAKEVRKIVYLVKNGKQEESKKVYNKLKFTTGYNFDFIKNKYKL